MPIVLTVACVVCVGALLVAEYRSSAALRWVSKPAASLAFVALGFALVDPRGSWLPVVVVAALVLGALGDILLIPEHATSFLAGLGAFLFSHVAYAIAFGWHAQTWSARAWLVSGVAMLVMAVLAGTVGRYLAAHAPPEMRAPVWAYIAVISVMVALAAGAWTAGRTPALAFLAAALFYASDISVALDRFVQPRFSHRAWGLPLYYAAQLAFAWSLAA